MQCNIEGETEICEGGSRTLQFHSLGVRQMHLFHRRRNQGATAPPRFQNICFRPPQISKPEINQHWLVITFKHVL